MILGKQTNSVKLENSKLYQFTKEHSNQMNHGRKFKRISHIYISEVKKKILANVNLDLTCLFYFIYLDLPCRFGSI